jgi:hypothetical protein
MTARDESSESSESSESHTEILTREGLYEAVWSVPIAKLAGRYGLSGPGFSKLCRRAGVPIPTRGYWARLASGQRPPRAKLRESTFGKELARPLIPLSPEDLEARGKRAAELMAIKESISINELPELSAQSHPLARAAKQRLSRRTGWEPDRLIRSAPEEVIAIYVSSGAVDRACRLASVLLMELQKVGAAIAHEAGTGKTLIRLAGVSLPLEIHEHIARTKHEKTRSEERAIRRWHESARFSNFLAEYPHVPDHDYTATGMLTLTVGNYPKRNWRDTSVRGLEHRLAEMVLGVLTLAGEVAARKLADELRAEKYEREQRHHEQELARWTGEREAFRRAVRDARRWEDADRLRRFARAAVTSGHDAINSVPAEDWVRWALKKADWLDPLVQAPDDILDAEKPKRPARW